VELRWSQEQKAFYSVGKIGVSNIGNQDINMQMDGIVEIRKRPNGDEAVVYLELTPDVWYYWSFQQGQLALLSSDDAFNSVIDSKAKGKSKPGQYAFGPADGNEKEIVLESFLKNYNTGTKPFVAKKVERKVAEPETTETFEDNPASDVTDKAAKKDKKKAKKNKKDENLDEPLEETISEEKPADVKTAEKSKSTEAVEKTDTKANTAKTEEKTKKTAEKAPQPEKKDKKKAAEAEEEEKEGF